MTGDLAVRAVMVLVAHGYTIEQATDRLSGVALDDVLAEIGAFPDRPLVRGGTRPR